MTTAKTPRPLFSRLTPGEARAVMERNTVGRLGFLNHGRVDIEPIHYVVGDGWLFLRSANGAKMEAIARDPFVAFEVDEIEGPFDWRSVVARGTIYFLAGDRGPVERRELDRAIGALRELMPDALTQDDPTPFRQTVYGLHIDELTGRMAESGTKRSKRQPLEPPPVSNRPRTPDGF